MNGINFTDRSKVRMYLLNHFDVAPPPVPTRLWNIGDWCAFIDSDGAWRPDLPADMISKQFNRSQHEETNDTSFCRVRSTRRRWM